MIRLLGLITYEALWLNKTWFIMGMPRIGLYRCWPPVSQTWTVLSQIRIRFWKDPGILLEHVKHWYTADTLNDMKTYWWAETCWTQWPKPFAQGFLIEFVLLFYLSVKKLLLTENWNKICTKKTIWQAKFCIFLSQS